MRRNKLKTVDERLKCIERQVGLLESLAINSGQEKYKVGYNSGYKQGLTKGKEELERQREKITANELESLLWSLKEEDGTLSWCYVKLNTAILNVFDFVTKFVPANEFESKMLEVFREMLSGIHSSNIQFWRTLRGVREKKSHAKTIQEVLNG